MKQSIELPKYWAQSSLRNICKDIVGGGTPSTKVERYWKGNIPWISSADILGLRNIVPRRKITEDAINGSAANKVSEGTIIVVTRVGLGKIGIAPFDLCFSQDSQGLIFYNGVIETDYALLFLSTAVQSFKHSGRGTTISGVTKKQLGELTVQIPPLAEQKQIATKVDEMFSDLDNAIENLKKAREQSKIYRQAVLKGAFEGYFSKDSLGIKSWKELTVNEIGEVITGSTPSKKEMKYYGRKYPLYKPGDLDAGLVTVDSVDGLTEEGIKKARMLPAKSVLVTCIGATIGKTGLIRKTGACNQQINAIVPKDFMVSEYVYYYCVSPQFQEQIKTNASATTLPILNKTKFQRLMFLVPTLNEQKQIVQEIDSRFSICDKLEESINENLQKAESLRQSILKQAFEGKLTDQWRNDHNNLVSGENSAESLLKKIEIKKEALRIKSKGRKKE